MKNCILEKWCFLQKNQFMYYLQTAYKNGEVIFPGNTAEHGTIEGFSSLEKRPVVEKLGCRCRTASRQSRSCYRLPWPLHTQCRNLQSSNTRSFERQSDFFVQKSYKRNDRDHDDHCRGVHSPLSFARHPQRFHANPVLRFSGQSLQKRES